MPVPPSNPYVKFTCRSCKWSVVIKQTSDVRIGPGTCKKCGATDLLITQASMLSMLTNSLFHR